MTPTSRSKSETPAKKLAAKPVKAKAAAVAAPKAAPVVKAQSTAPAAQAVQERGRRRERQGVVISDKMNKTIVVEITRLVPHPLYNRVVKRKTKAAAHDEENKAKLGDVVRIVETHPISKTKRWKLVEVISK